MLRVSSLGLLRHHVPFQRLPLRRPRVFSKTARQTAETGDARQDGVRADANQEMQTQSHNMDMDVTYTSASENLLVDPDRGPVIAPANLSRTRKKTGVRKPQEETANAFWDDLSSDPSLASERSPGSDPLMIPSGQQAEEIVFDLDAAVPDKVQAEDSHAFQSRLLGFLATTKSVSEAWDAYQQLISLPAHDDRPSRVFYSRLHRLARLLCNTRPRTRTLFLRLMSVLYTIHITGGHVQDWEWNGLVDCAGKGWRKTRLEDFQAALGVYNDMVLRRPPGTTHGHQYLVTSDPSDDRPAAKPNVVTYTALLNIAGRTLNYATLRHASKMLEASGIPPNRITSLVLIRYFTRINDLTGVRATLQQMKEQGHELQQDGLNACIWAFARNGRIDVAGLVYRIMRHNSAPEDYVGESDIRAAIAQLAATEGITIPDTIKPGPITFYTLIQCYAYHGDLIRALSVFSDLMTRSEETGILHERSDPNDPGDSERLEKSPTMPAFRAIFLGFARHGKSETRHLRSAGPLTMRLTSATSAWNLNNLEALFDSFLKLPHDSHPSDRTIYWILSAFDKLSGGADWKLRRVWQRLEDRFGRRWGGRLERFRQRIHKDSEDEQYNEIR